MSHMSNRQRSAIRKAHISARVDPEVLDHIANRASRADVDSSHMIRRMLAYAARHMPADWLPSGDDVEPGPDQPGEARRAS